MLDAIRSTPPKRLLSPRQLASAIGVSESSLKRWIDDGLLLAVRTVGKHRRIPMAEAIRFIRSQRSPLLRPDVLGLPELDAVADELTPRDELGDRLFAFLSEGRSAETRGLMLSMYLGGMSVAEIADGPLRQAIHRIGELWKHAADGIFIEHRATDICVQAVNQVRALLEPLLDAPRAVGGAPSNDPYLLPSLLASCVLSENGFHATNLGPDTPQETLVHAAQTSRATLCWLSVSALRDAEEISELITELAVQLGEFNAALIVGGHAILSIDLSELPNVHFGPSMAALAEVAHTLRAA